MVTIFFTYQAAVESTQTLLWQTIAYLSENCICCGMVMFQSSGEIMLDCVSAKQARIFSTVSK